MDLEGPEKFSLLPFHNIECSIRSDIYLDNFLILRTRIGFLKLLKGNLLYW